MTDARRGIRRLFLFYGWVCLAGGVAVLLVTLLLRLLNAIIDWSTPLGWTDMLIFGAGLIVVLISLGPYLATVGQLAGVAKIRPASIQTGPPSSSRERLILYAGLGVVGVVFAVVLLTSKGLAVWLTFIILPIFMGLCLFYLAWRIGRIERKAKITIYQTDYRWRFDRTSYIGVYQNPVKK
ncbi:MAG: hypothetical protein J0I20_18965 [Chloroflexi bacterium]|nr:hypothetical protein [Chloroflexota bacterium]OJW00793.1 MAG: hypothetical protein BGO39_20360 [Chloroflexi bacterium 54-19]